MQGFQICRMFNLKPKTVPDIDCERMDLLYWKYERANEAKFDPLKDDGLSRAEEVHAWEDWALANYE